MTSRSRPLISRSAACGPRSGPIALMRSASIRMSPVNGVLPWAGSMAMMVAWRMSVDIGLLSSDSARRAGHQGHGLAAVDPLLDDGVGFGRHELLCRGRPLADRTADVVRQAIDRHHVGRVGQRIGVEDAVDPSPPDGRDAHLARLAARIDVAARQVEGAQPLAGVADGRHLAMQRGVVIDQHCVAAFAHDPAVSDDHGGEGRGADLLHLAAAELDGVAHEVGVGHGGLLAIGRYGANSVPWHVACCDLLHTRIAGELAMSKAAVPVIDISPYRGADAAARRALAAEVDRTCREIGFMVISRHGIDPDLIAAVEDISRTFFDLPLEEKKQIVRPAPDVTRGYMPMKAEVLVRSRGGTAQGDLNESLMIGPVDVTDAPYYTSPAAGRAFAKNLWPERPPGLRQVYERYYRVMDALAIDLMRLFALALALPERYFDSSVDRSISRLRVRNYPAPAETPEPGQLRAGA